MPLNIVVADDHPAIGLGIKYMVLEWMPEARVTLVGDMAELLKLLESDVVNILILDINIPGGNSFNMVDVVRKVQEEVKILIFSMFDEIVYGLRYIESGADGYLQKNSVGEELKRAIHVVLANKKYISEELKEHLLEKRILKLGSANNKLEKLTNRQLEICNLLVSGMSVSEIGHTLLIHTSTVGTIKAKVFEKLSVRNIRELIDLVNLGERRESR